jgi:hypothetical protein
MVHVGVEKGRVPASVLTQVEAWVDGEYIYIMDFTLKGGLQL